MLPHMIPFAVNGFANGQRQLLPPLFKSEPITIQQSGHIDQELSPVLYQQLQPFPMTHTQQYGSIQQPMIPLGEHYGGYNQQVYSQQKPGYSHIHYNSKRKTKSLPMIGKFHSNQIITSNHSGIGPQLTALVTNSNRSSGSSEHRSSRKMGLTGGLGSSASGGSGESGGSASGPNDTLKINYPIQKLTPTTLSFIPIDKFNLLKEIIYPLVEIKRYTTSTIDPTRHYLTVFQYPINNHWVIWDYETGFVHLTGVWKASMSADYIKSHAKADIVKLLESTPRQYHQHIKRIRGGFLKIQGTWLPFDLCRILARRFCYHIRYELIPLFGIDFPDYCLNPNDKGFGELRLDEATGVAVAVPEESTFNALEPRIILDSNVSGLATAGHSKIKKHSKANKNSRKHEKRNKLLLGEKENHVLAQTSLPLLAPPLVPSVATPATSPTQFNDSIGGFIVATPNTKPRMLEPATPLNRLTSNISPSSNSRHMSYSDMVDIVNASKCLQSLSNSNQVSPISVDENNRNSLRQNNYIATSDSSNRSINDSSDGILSILLAAGVSDDSPVRNGAEHKQSTRVSVSINDLLT
ncbi:uncharacterized protein PRCAT00004765001 [Priceomyces carsonii]|uniref:uncharacterized protein n=1 Tax=Priceomyces carsonii TaxID=28549 RepID=UPI002EDAB679|nr:unnamed protein product [Priceomyces carsonii]